MWRYLYASSLRSAIKLRLGKLGVLNLCVQVPKNEDPKDTTGDVMGWGGRVRKVQYLLSRTYQSPITITTENMFPPLPEASP